MTDYSGYVAALGTAFLFSFGSTFFTISGREIGSATVNRVRILIAWLVIIAIHALTFGQPLPFNATAQQWFWMGLSGFVGLALGDAFLFQGFVMVGPRLSMLMMALAPVIGAILAFVFLGERLQLQDFFAIILVVSGIAWVVSDKAESNGAGQTKSFTRRYWIGLAFAFGGAVGQAGGLVLSKIGLQDGFEPLSANLIRVTIAVISIWAVGIANGQFMNTFRQVKAHPRAGALLTLGALTGPVSGVWLSLIAVQRAPVGIASTLMALTPIFLIPISYVVFRDKPTLRAIVGTLVAFAGTALFFL